MTEPTEILIANLTNALQQVNTYLALGLVTAVSAFVVDRRPASRKESPVEVPGGFISMEPETAKLVLLAISFVAGVLANYAAEASVRIIRMLEGEPELLNAACTYSSIATAPIGVRVIAAALPVAFVVPILWRIWSRIRKLSPEDGRGLITLIGFFVAPYAALVIMMVRLKCGA